MDGDGEARIPASSFMSLAHIVRRSRQLCGASLALHDDERQPAKDGQNTFVHRLVPAGVGAGAGMGAGLRLFLNSGSGR
jgi:hypothetical protein